MKHTRFAQESAAQTQAEANETTLAAVALSKSEIELIKYALDQLGQMARDQAGAMRRRIDAGRDRDGYAARNVKRYDRIVSDTLKLSEKL